MSWKGRIYTHLSLLDRSPKIISDSTGVLSTKAFKDYLMLQKAEEVYSDSTSKMLASANSNQQITFITSKQSIPQFLKSHFEFKSFSYTNLPLNGDLNLLKKYDAVTIVSLCDYIFSNNPHLVISTSNIKDLIYKSKRFESIKELESSKSKLNELLEKDPTINQVLELASNWGKLTFQSYQNNNDDFLKQISKIDEVSKNFIISKKFEQIAFASTASKPLSIDKITHHIKSKKQDKIALLCFDCMGVAEWHLLKEYLKDLDLKFKENFVYTLLPSVTSICRSSIFHGSTDVYNIKSPGRKNEAKAISNFFKEKQFKYFIDDDEINENTLLGYDYISVLFNFFDDLCHSTLFPANENTKSIYFDNCKQYLNKSNVKQTIKNLFDSGYSLYFCSDHGSVIAKGNGEKLQKYLIDDFAKRAIIIPEEASELTEFEKIDIPFVKHKKLVLPVGRTMFSQKDKIEINHGGISLEEIVVPFITVEK